MKDSLKIAIGIFLGVIALGACVVCLFFGLGAAGIGLLAAAAPTSSQAQSQSTINQIGSSIIHDDLKVTLNTYDISGSYVGQYDMQESPPQGAKFLWISITAENVGKVAAYAPAAYEFHVIYAGQQTDHDFISWDRPGYDEYEGGEIFPGVTKLGWIRFTIPNAAQPNKINVIFKPSDLFSDTYYTWTLTP